MTYPIHPGSSFQAAQIGESRQTLSLPPNFFVENRHNDCPLSSIATAPPPWGKPSNLWTPFIYSLRLRVPSWIRIRWIQYATHRNKFNRLQYWLCRLRCKIPLRHLATSSLGSIFWRHSRFSPKQPEPQTHGWLQHSCPQPANMTFATLMATYLTYTFNNALT